MHSLNRTALLVLNYKKFSDALNFLQSIVDHEVGDADIIIVDNGSGNGSVEAIRRWLEQNVPATESAPLCPHEFAVKDARFSVSVKLAYSRGRIALFESSENFGFSGGNNALAVIGRQLGYEYLYFLNSDVVFTDKFAVSKMVALHEREPTCYVSGPCVINREGGFDSPYRRDSFWGDALYYGYINSLRRVLGLPIVQFDIDALSVERGALVYKISGAAMFFPTGRFFEIGGLDENVWLSCEEAILAEKIRARGGKVMYLPTTVLIHVKASAPREAKRRVDILRNHYKQRNYFYRVYRGYNAWQMALLIAGQKLRLLIARVKG